MDPKFVMAITAKVNMVLHGDGSAHIFKYDGLAPLDRLEDDRLRPLADAQRSVERKRYKPDVSERFDAVVSNPPFGITLAAESRAARARTFSAPASAPSEALFLERWFQLLKPKGRLGVVVPESLLNTGDATEYRLFLYRFFWIRAIVAMSRNIFIETPTLTSLLFAQKKTSEAAAEWDRLWEAESARVETSVRDVETYLEMVRRSSEVKPEQITDQVLSSYPAC